MLFSINYPTLSLPDCKDYKTLLSGLLLCLNVENTSHRYSNLFIDYLNLLELYLSYFCSFFIACMVLLPSTILIMFVQYHPSRNLRSSNSFSLVVAKTHTLWGDRSFTHARASLWNELPQIIRNISDVHKLKVALKTHLFKKYFLNA